MRFVRREVEISGGRKLYLYEFADNEPEDAGSKEAEPSAEQEAPKGNLDPEDFQHK